MDNFRINEVAERLSEDNRVLDIGCVRHNQERRSGGDLHAEIANKADEVVGVDIVEAEVNTMKAEGFDVRVGDAENLDEVGFENEFDVVVAGELIEHLSNPGDFLDGAYQLTKPEGRLILTTPNPHWIGFTKKALLGENNNQEHTCWFDQQFIEQLGMRHGWVLDNLTYRPPQRGISRLVWGISKRIGSPGFIAEFTK